MGAMQLQAKEGQGLSEVARSYEEIKNRFFSAVISKGNVALTTS